METEALRQKLISMIDRVEDEDLLVYAHTLMEDILQYQSIPPCSLHQSSVSHAAFASLSI